MNMKNKNDVGASLLSEGLAVAQAEFEKNFDVPDGVIFKEWSYGAGYVCDKSKHVPGSIPMAEEFNRYWSGWISAWRTLTANA